MQSFCQLPDLCSQRRVGQRVRRQHAHQLWRVWQVLEELATAHPIAALLQERRTLAKLLRDFLNTFSHRARRASIGSPGAVGRRSNSHFDQMPGPPPHRTFWIRDALSRHQGCTRS